MQELTETAGSMDKVCLVVTFPSSIIEHYDESAERLFLQLQKVAGRVEKIYTPVEENEIAKVIRRRLFSEIKEQVAKGVISEFIEYAEKGELYQQSYSQPSIGTDLLTIIHLCQRYWMFLSQMGKLPQLSEDKGSFKDFLTCY